VSANPIDVPRSEFGSRVRAHIGLTKPRIIELLLVTAVPTMFLAAQGLPTVATAIAVLAGGALSAGSANTFNSVYDRDIDALMKRTGHRPAVQGSVSVRAGIAQGVILGVLSVVVLAALANVLAALLSLLAIGMYVVGYTIWLKRRTPQNIVWGGAAGCMPVLIAWAAVTDSLSWTPFVLFLIVFFWTPPHYWPLAIKYREDYAAAGVPMLPVVAPMSTVVRHVVAYSWVMVATSLVLIPVASMGWVYSIGAVGCGAFFLYLAYGLRKVRDQAPEIIELAAMRLFHGSITYLAVIFLLVGIDPFLV
jgi:protoheme IX farnesyltransferase